MSTTSMANFSNPLFRSYSVYARNASITRKGNYYIRIVSSHLSHWSVNDSTGTQGSRLKSNANKSYFY